MTDDNLFTPWKLMFSLQCSDMATQGLNGKDLVIMQSVLKAHFALWTDFRQLLFCMKLLIHRDLYIYQK